MHQNSSKFGVGLALSPPHFEDILIVGLTSFLKKISLSLFPISLDPLYFFFFSFSFLSLSFILSFFLSFILLFGHHWPTAVRPPFSLKRPPLENHTVDQLVAKIWRAHVPPLRRKMQSKFWIQNFAVKFLSTPETFLGVLPTVTMSARRGMFWYLSCPLTCRIFYWSYCLSPAV